MTERVTRLLELLDTDGRRLHVLLTRLTLCETTAEDLLQELFLRLSKSNSFDSARNHTAYAFRAATNLAFEWRRKQSRTVQPESLATDPIAKTRSAEESLELGESCDEVLRRSVASSRQDVRTQPSSHRNASLARRVVRFDRVAARQNAASSPCDLQ